MSVAYFSSEIVIIYSSLLNSNAVETIDVIITDQFKDSRDLNQSYRASNCTLKVVGLISTLETLCFLSLGKIFNANNQIIAAVQLSE